MLATVLKRSTSPAFLIVPFQFNHFLKSRLLFKNRSWNVECKNRMKNVAFVYVNNAYKKRK